MRAAREEERQQRLKKAERMAGEMGVRAAEQEAELDQRIKKAQEEARCTFRFSFQNSFFIFFTNNRQGRKYRGTLKTCWIKLDVPRA